MELPMSTVRDVLLLLVSLTSVLVACSTVTQNPIPSDDELALRAARSAQNDAIASARLDDVAEFWTEDVTVRAGLGRAISGRMAYRAAFASDSTIVYDRETDNVAFSDRWPVAWEEGSWTGRRRQDGELLISGRYATQWIKSDGDWKIRSELFVALECSAVGCSWPIARE
jgi:ketosteroid isomerase-like protein